jgi:arabinofuranosyltransferase
VNEAAHNPARDRVPPTRVIPFAAAALAVAALFIVFRSAWVSDDAFITFRTIDNILHGFGPRWNIAERVQTFTHPLWLLLLTPLVAITDNPYLTSIGLSLVLTALTLGLVVWQLRREPWGAAFAVIVLAGSRSFVDFSTSGLENALSHALLALLMLIVQQPVAGRRRALSAGIVLGLLGTTRMDLLVVGGTVAALSLRNLRQTGVAFVLGGVPLLCWEVFAVVYYGVPFPNTAYAKLATGIPQAELTHQGIAYLLDSLNRDPLTLFAIVAAIMAPLAIPTPATRSVSVALILALIYVVRIGGDFMSGRFLTGPLVVAVCSLGRVTHARTVIGRLAPLAGAIALSLAAQIPTVALLAGEVQPTQAQLWPPSGIVDERAYYFDRTSLVTDNGYRTRWYQPDIAVQLTKLLAQHPTTVLQPTVGAVGYYLGPRRHVIDTLALGDPLLARLPAKPHWRVGHYERAVPDGYVESVATDSNRISDPAIRDLYETIRNVTRGPLFTWERWKAIVRLNTAMRIAD